MIGFTFRRRRSTRHFQTQPRYVPLSFLFPSFFDLDLARSFFSLSYSSYILDPSLFSLSIHSTASLFIPLPLYSFHCLSIHSTASLSILAALGFTMVLNCNLHYTTNLSYSLYDQAYSL